MGVFRRPQRIRDWKKSKNEVIVETLRERCVELVLTQWRKLTDKGKMRKYCELW